MEKKGKKPKLADTIQIDGREVKKLREKSRLTQERLASLVCRTQPLSRGYLPALERKPVARVSRVLAEALAAALGVTVDELVQVAPIGQQQLPSTQSPPVTEGGVMLQILGEVEGLKAELPMLNELVQNYDLSTAVHLLRRTPDLTTAFADFARSNPTPQNIAEIVSCLTETGFRIKGLSTQQAKVVMKHWENVNSENLALERSAGSRLGSDAGL